jgi:hypothetical protein
MVSLGPGAMLLGSTCGVHDDEDDDDDDEVEEDDDEDVDVHDVDCLLCIFRCLPTVSALNPLEAAVAVCDGFCEPGVVLGARGDRRLLSFAFTVGIVLGSVGLINVLEGARGIGVRDAMNGVGFFSRREEGKEGFDDDGNAGVAVDNEVEELEVEVCGWFGPFACAGAGCGRVSMTGPVACLLISSSSLLFSIQSSSVTPPSLMVTFRTSVRAHLAAG